MDTSTGMGLIPDSRNVPTPLGAVSSSIPIVLLPPENLLLKIDVDTRVRPYQLGKETGYLIGGGADCFHPCFRAGLLVSQTGACLI